MDAESTRVDEWSDRMAQLCHRAAVQVSGDLMNLINNGRDTIVPTHMLTWLNDYLYVLEEGGVLDDPSERLQAASMQQMVTTILQMRRDATVQANTELSAIITRSN